MFIVCEPIALGMEHVPFNAALLKTIRLAYHNDKICFYAENAHSKFVQEQIGEKLEASIFWKDLALPPRHANFYTRLSSDFRTVNFLLNKIEKSSSKDVLVITGNASLLWALKFYTWNIHKDKRVQVVIHGDFSTLSRTPLRGILNPFYHIGSLKTALKLPGYERIQHIVLEKSVKSLIIKHMPFLRNNIFVLDHPIPVDEYHNNIKKLDNPIQFGFLGRATEKKGFSKYLDVASEILTQFPDKVKFHFIGRINEKYKRKNLSKLTVLDKLPQTERLSRSEYTINIKSLHFVCLFYDNYYEFCASGVLLDSIAYEKPIIAINLEIFKTLQKNFGDIGYLCENNELSDTIRSIVQRNDSDRYNRQVLIMRKVKVYRTPETLALKYHDLIRLFEKN